MCLLDRIQIWILVILKGVNLPIRPVMAYTRGIKITPHHSSSLPSCPLLHFLRSRFSIIWQKLLEYSTCTIWQKLSIYGKKKFVLKMRSWRKFYVWQQEITGHCITQMMAQQQVETSPNCQQLASSDEGANYESNQQKLNINWIHIFQNVNIQTHIVPQIYSWNTNEFVFIFSVFF